MADSAKYNKPLNMGVIIFGIIVGFAAVVRIIYMQYQ
jgi:hypothetical protein